MHAEADPSPVSAARVMSLRVQQLQQQAHVLTVAVQRRTWSAVLLSVVV
jgi:hypothetical protein